MRERLRRPLAAALVASGLTLPAGVAIVGGATPWAVAVRTTLAQTVVDPALEDEAANGDRIYIANEVSNSVSVVNPATLAAEAPVVLGDPNHHAPLYKGQIDIHGLMASPDGRVLAAAARGSSDVVFIDRLNKTVLGSVLVGREPHVATFTPDNKKAWVAVRGAAYIAVVDVATLTLEKKIPTVDGPSMVFFAQVNGKSLAFVGSQKVPALDVFDTATGHRITQLVMPGSFSPFVLGTPDGKEVWVTQKRTNTVTIVDVEKLTVSVILDVGPGPNHVAFAQQNGERLAYITIAGNNTVEVYRRGDVGVVPTKQAVIPVGVEPHGIWPDRHGERLYIGHERSNDLWALKVENNTIIGKVAVGTRPIDVVYARTEPVY